MYNRIDWRLIYLLFVLPLAGCSGFGFDDWWGTKPSDTPEPATSRPYTINGVRYYPLKSAKNYKMVGIGSWYGKKFHGRLTANGEVYNMYGITAAHTILPLPTRVRVTNLENGRQIELCVNDRGPFVKNRLIDLSYAAAERLGYAKQGTALVRVEALPISETRRLCPVSKKRKSRSDDQKDYTVQVGSFTQLTNAQRLVNDLKHVGKAHIQRVEIQGQPFFRVRFGPFKSLTYATKVARTLKRRGFPKERIMIE
ncbi:septal ring lytic transglycosylase RlpA family protein [Magnetococcales bacterium HHB-1]